MKKANILSVILVLALSLFAAGAVSADDDLPEPRESEPQNHQEAN